MREPQGNRVLILATPTTEQEILALTAQNTSCCMHSWIYPWRPHIISRVAMRSSSDAIRFPSPSHQETNIAACTFHLVYFKALVYSQVECSLIAQIIVRIFHEGMVPIWTGGFGWAASAVLQRLHTPGSANSGAYHSAMTRRNEILDGSMASIV